jgi:hypothetical protein
MKRESGNKECRLIEDTEIDHVTLSRRYSPVQEDFMVADIADRIQKQIYRDAE